MTSPHARHPHSLPFRLAKSAQRALAAAGYTTLEQLTRMTEAHLARMHGIGPKAIAQARQALAAARLRFATGN